MASTAKLLKAQQSLPGMKPKELEDLEKKILDWQEAVDVFKEATEGVVKAKTAVREFMAANNIEKPIFIDGLGTVEWQDEKDRDIVFKKIKRKKEEE